MLDMNKQRLKIVKLSNIYNIALTISRSFFLIILHFSAIFQKDWILKCIFIHYSKITVYQSLIKNILTPDGEALVPFFTFRPEIFKINLDFKAYALFLGIKFL